MGSTFAFAFQEKKYDDREVETPAPATVVFFFVGGGKGAGIMRTYKEGGRVIYR
jgi:hypothetical protein